MPARIDPLARSNRRFSRLAALAVGLLGLASGAHATFYQVNSSADVPDANVSAAACETATGNGVCTLRAAVQQANAHAGADTILVPANTYVLSRAGLDSNALNGDLDITGDVTIIGAGPGSTIIDGNGAVTGDRVFQIIGSIKVSMSGLTIQHGVARSNDDRDGGGIDNAGSLELKNCIVADNGGEGAAFGGGIHSSGPLTISDSTINGNTSGLSGGGLMAEANVVITNSTFSGNTAAYGGGIFAAKTLTDVKTTILVNDTVSGNTSTGDGGGINADSGVLKLYNVTVAGNQANADKSGGGGGAGIYNRDASVTLNNSIISGNASYIDGSPFVFLADCAGTFASSGITIVTHATCTINGPYSPDVPKLGPLQDNGGPTQTHALLPGSPALDVGTCDDPVGAPLDTDQRGVARPQGIACDLGAFELEDLIFADGFEPNP
jgi:predicted outer membrane repeat protein